MIIHQSLLSSWNRCPAQVGYERAGRPGKQLSATAFGSVIHAALNVFERVRVDEGFDAGLAQAKATFRHYWHPLQIEAICEPVPADGWLPRQGYSELLVRGIDTIEKFADLVRFDDCELLATEYSFLVPIPGSWDYQLNEPHMLAGTVDRLVARHYARKLTLVVEDLKSGTDKKYLRQNLQFSAYAMASTLPEFWTGAHGEEGFGQQRGMELYERFENAARRGTWISLRSFKFLDAGWRGPDDYKRFALAVDQIALSIQADIFPFTLDGEVCTYCPQRAICGGVGVPKNDHGRP